MDPQVEDTVEKSSPLQRLGAKLSEIKAGLGSVQDKLQQRSPSLSEAERTQKVRVINTKDCSRISQTS